MTHHQPKFIDFDKKWEDLSIGLKKVISLKYVSVQPLVEDIYDICTAIPEPLCELLYGKIKELFKEHILFQRDMLLSSPPAEFLSTFLSIWNTFSLGCQYSCDILKYLERTWIKKRLSAGYYNPTYMEHQKHHKVILDIYSLGLSLFREHLLSTLLSKVTHSALDVVQLCRRGDSLDLTPVRQFIDCLVTLGTINLDNRLDLYTNGFEKPFFADMVHHYQRESELFFQTHSVSRYMTHIQECIEEETARAKLFLISRSHKTMREKINKVLIEGYKDRITASCDSYLRENRLEDLQRMYNILSLIDSGVLPMVDSLFNYMLTYAKELIQGDPSGFLHPDTISKHYLAYIDTLKRIHSEFLVITEHVFANDFHFIEAVDMAHRQIINGKFSGVKPHHSAELLAKYCDTFLKRSKQSLHLSEIDLEVHLVESIALFTYIEEKDVFQTHYAKFLAIRLLNSSSLSKENEYLVINRLKSSCGFEYTSRLQRMFTDVAISSDLTKRFKKDFFNDNNSLEKKDKGKSFPKKQRRGSKIISNLSKKIHLYSQHNHTENSKTVTDGFSSSSLPDFHVLILTSGSWPLTYQANDNAIIIPEFKALMNSFHQFYLSQYQGRKLNWLHHFSSGELRTSYLDRRYEFQVSIFQMSILLLFNHTSSLDHKLSMGYISKNAHISDDQESNRTLKSLVDSSVLLRTSSSNSSLYRDSDLFSLNKNFSRNRIRIKLSNMFLMETKQEVECSVKSHIEEDRCIFLQAAIVRIMKSHLTLQHVMLVKEVINQAKSRFQPKIANIKRSIELLIEKDYIQRDSLENEKYHYVS